MVDRVDKEINYSFLSKHRNPMVDRVDKEINYSF